MKYYLLRKVSDPEIKGVKTGLGQVELDAKNPITAKLEHFFSGINYWDRQKFVPDFEIENCTATLYKGAKLTDFLDFSPFLFTCPFMLSERLAEVFRKFSIQQYYTYPVTLFDKGNQLPDKYYLFCCPLLGYDIVDFSKSVFYTQQGFSEKRYVHFESEEQYRNYNETKKVEKLVLNSKFDSSLDFFTGRIGGMFVSEALKDAIEILGFTGVNIFGDKEPEIIIT